MTQQPNQTLNKMMGVTPKDSKQSQKKSMILDSTIQRIFSDLNNITRRVRILEERFFEDRKKLGVIEQNSIESDKELEIKNKALFEEVSTLKKTITEMKDKMNIMIKELQASAKLSDVKVLEKYITMWEPLDYVTFEAMDKNVGHLIDLKFNELNLKIQQENFIKKEVEKQIKKIKEDLNNQNNDSKEDSAVDMSNNKNNNSGSIENYLDEDQYVEINPNDKKENRKEENKEEGK